MGSENPNVTRVRGVADPLTRAAEAHLFITNGRKTLEAMQQVRDDAIRATRATGRLTIDEIAARIGCKRNVVVDALRQKEN